MKDKITVLSNTEKDEQLAALQAFLRNQLILTEYVTALAKLRKHSFDAHLAQGFTQEQALELCRKIP